MSDLISKKALIKVIENIEARYGNDNSSLIEQGEVLDLIEEAITVDAEPVVRCGECKHRGTDDCPMHIKGVPADEGFLKIVDNDFCSYGERKDEVSE